MSRSAKTTIFLGKDEFPACLKIEQLIALQETLDSGPYALSMRLVTGDWTVQDIRETIRFGLMGGDPDLKHREVNRLLNTYVVEGHLADYHVEAQKIILAAITGVDDEEIPQEPEEETDEGKSQTPRD